MLLKFLVGPTAKRSCNCLFQVQNVFSRSSALLNGRSASSSCQNDVPPPIDCNAPEDCSAKDAPKDTPKDLVKITVCGSTGDVGRPLSLLLKKSARSKIVVIVTEPSVGTKRSSSACRGAGDDDDFKKNGKIVKEICESCLETCPNAIIAIVADPVSSMVPLACEVMKKRGKVENIKRILGITGLDCLRCESMVSSMLNIPMGKLQVPVVGGTSAETLVPLLSHMKPHHAFTKDEFASLTEGLRAAVTEVEKAGGVPTITKAYAAANFIETLCKVIKGEEGVQQCAFVATPHWLALGYLACPVRLCKDGVEEVLYPPINEFEQCLLNKAERQLKEEIKQGMDFIRCDTSGEMVSTD